MRRSDVLTALFGVGLLVWVVEFAYETLFPAERRIDVVCVIGILFVCWSAGLFVWAVVAAIVDRGSRNREKNGAN